MSTIAASGSNEFTWEVQPAAARWVRRALRHTARVETQTIGRLADVLLRAHGHAAGRLDRSLGAGRCRRYAELSTSLAGCRLRRGQRRRRGLAASAGHVSAGGCRMRAASAIGIRCESVEDCLAPLPAALGLVGRVDPSSRSDVHGGEFRHGDDRARDGVGACGSSSGMDIRVSMYVTVGPTEIARGARNTAETFRRRQRDSTRRMTASHMRRNCLQRGGRRLGRRIGPAICSLPPNASIGRAATAPARVQYERQNRLGSRLGQSRSSHVPIQPRRLSGI